jgi:hypothetical protein
MARRLFVGMVVAMFVMAAGSRALAAPAPIYRGSDVKFTIAGTPKESTLIAEALGARVTKRVGREIVKIRIEAAKDLVDLEANANGKVRMSRRGRTVVIDLANRDQQLIAEARRMTEGSPALTSFDALIEALDADNSAVAASWRTTWALLNAMRGNDGAVMAVARRVTSHARKGPFIPASFTREREEGPTACWVEYSSTVNSYYTEYAECLVDYGWIPMAAQGCTFEWLVKSELAWFWLIACDGGIPA